MDEQPTPSKRANRARMESLFAGLCLLMAWSLAPTLESELNALGSPDGSDSESIADGVRTLAAEHCYQKSLSYFHSGAWYSIFDHVARSAVDTTADVVRSDGSLPEAEMWRCETPFSGPELDWLDGFGRNFIPTRHTHLTSGGARGDNGNFAYEMLPWLELAVRFDPHHIPAYEDADYWLRKQLKRPKVAEGFLRRGAARNPESHQLRFLLGVIAAEHHGDLARARRCWSRALRLWESQNADAAEPDVDSFRRIAGRLARLEEREGRLTEARILVERLRPMAAQPQRIDQWLAEIDAASIQFEARSRRVPAATSLLSE
jgi:tetratricopeptide (TPR) repeat protein